MRYQYVKMVTPKDLEPYIYFTAEKEYGEQEDDYQNIRMQRSTVRFSLSEINEMNLSKDYSKLDAWKNQKL